MVRFPTNISHTYAGWSSFSFAFAASFIKGERAEVIFVKMVKMLPYAMGTLAVKVCLGGALRTR